MTRRIGGTLKVLCSAAALMTGIELAHAEDAVLVSSTVGSYMPGTVITDGQVLALPAGSNATLLFRSGGIIRVTGPFEGSLDAMRPAGAATGAEGLVEALRTQGVDASVLGASRGWTTPKPMRRAGEGAGVTVDTQRSAIYCIGPDDSLSLRGPSEAASIVRIRRGRNVREIALPEGAPRVPWPADVPVEDGDRFEVLDKSGAAVSTMIFHRLEPAPSPTAWIAASILAGCRDQVAPALRELAAELEKSSER